MDPPDYSFLLQHNPHKLHFKQQLEVVKQSRGGAARAAVRLGRARDRNVDKTIDSRLYRLQLVEEAQNKCSGISIEGSEKEEQGSPKTVWNPHSK